MTRTASAHTEPTAARHLAWLALGFIGSFFVPFLLADLLGLPRDLYYGVYFLFVGGLFVTWARDTGKPLGHLFSRRWPWALGLGLVFALISAIVALRAVPATPHPGLAFVGALIWRGVLYGAADGLLLSAFPILVVFAALSTQGERAEVGARVLKGALALVASLVMAATYHLGYSEFRSPKLVRPVAGDLIFMTATYHLGYSEFRSPKLVRPVAGDLIWSIPTLATLNPLGSPLAHARVHVGAVVHSYNTDLFLPPHRPRA